MDLAANAESGPKVTSDTPGRERDQYVVLAVCVRKNIGPKANTSMAVA
jgi:hypothetical protein